MKRFVSRRNQLYFIVSLFLMLDCQFISVDGFAISCTKAIKLSWRGAQEKLPGL